MKIILSVSCLFIFLAFAPGAFAVDIGEAAPEFNLSAHDGTEVKLSDYKDKVVVLEWFNAGCPYVQKHYRSEHMQGLQAGFSEKGVQWLVINSTRTDHRDYLSPEETGKVAAEYKIANATMLLDTDGKVGKLYEAKTTPHMFIIDKGKLVYQGAIDDATDVDGDPKAAKNFVKMALEEVVSGKPVTDSETKPYGCSVKYAK